MIPLIWFVAIHFVDYLITISWLRFCLIMIWFVCYGYALFDMIRFVLMPEFLFYSWRYHGRVSDGTTGMTLSGEVWLIPGIPFCLIYVHYGQLVIYVPSHELACVFCLIQEVYGCILGSVLFWEDSDWLYVPCTPFTSGTLELATLCTPYELTDMWLCDLRPIRVSR